MATTRSQTKTHKRRVWFADETIDQAVNSLEETQRRDALAEIAMNQLQPEVTQTQLKESSADDVGPVTIHVHSQEYVIAKPMAQTWCSQGLRPLSRCVYRRFGAQHLSDMAGSTVYERGIPSFS
ncbi:hypothetical protein GQ600_5849 [Phytophthora cactorum]|nr:hypothetical protein GQ600_5849 [Phytophthora cactorum]